ncbi:MAG: nuclear transport factor 2 family protein [Actinomycetota bacterium]|nr:nuclear transport factor 2 family protein [Actinomycetota bacterium]
MSRTPNVPPPATRSELEATFAEFVRRANEAAKTGDWTSWSEMYTDDARLVEPTYGEFLGRAAILEWMSSTMATSPGADMVAFPVHWHVVDEQRGVVVARFGNRLRDPGDGSVHEPWNLAVLTWGGDGRWASEEDVYDVGRFASEVMAWIAVRDAQA